jgi:glycosyltransferase involved in cell wall biosynthesis
MMLQVSDNKIPRILYISYDGMLEPLGQSQVLQYLKRLASGYCITLVSYEKPADWADTPRREALITEVRSAGISWVPLKYHKKLSALATVYDLFVGFVVCAFLAITRSIKIVHARSYVPSVIALGLKKFLGIRFIFDMRGFWADERVERGIWGEKSKTYSVVKWLERHFLLNADVVVSLTHAGVAVISKFSYLKGRDSLFEVIPTCTNLEKFSPVRSGGSDTINGDRDFVLGYVGSVDTAYMFDPVLRCFKMLRELREDARLLVITRSSSAYLNKLLKEYAIPERCVEVKAVCHDQVSEEIGRMDAGIFFVKTGFSAHASAPTKLGEFLACGVPCLGNSGVGDVESILEGESVGIILHEFSSDAEVEAVSSLLGLCSESEIKNRCVEVASRYFSLAQGVKSYGGIYDSLGRGGGDGTKYRS